MQQLFRIVFALLKSNWFADREKERKGKETLIKGNTE